MQIEVNCPECQGTGGLWDHALGIDDPCEMCDESGCMILEDREIPQWLWEEIMVMDKEIKKHGIANLIVGFEEVKCPCCKSKMNFEVHDDERTIVTKCSNEYACHFEVFTW